MPYITEEKRKKIEPVLKSFEELGALEAGELNYIFSSFLIIQTRKTTKISYDLLNSFLGVLESVKLEFYRRLVVNYEQEKCNLNGDIY